MNKTMTTMAAIGLGAAAMTVAKRNNFKLSKRKMRRLGNQFMRAIR